MQGVELDLSPYQGLVPVEMFGRIEFPAIGQEPYFITLGPHSFYWFSLEAARKPVTAVPAPEDLPALVAAGDWQDLFPEEPQRPVVAALSNFLARQRWFSGKAQGIRSLSIRERATLRPASGASAALALVDVQYNDGGTACYLIPITAAFGEKAQSVAARWPQAVIARLTGGEEGPDGIIYDGIVDEDVSAAILGLISGNRRASGRSGDVIGLRTRHLRQFTGPDPASLRPSVVHTEQSNSAISYGDRLFFKVFRRIENGINPDLEIARFLTGQDFPNTPRLAGALEYVTERPEPDTLGLLFEFIPNEGDAWSYTLDNLKHFFERALASQEIKGPGRLTARSILELAAAAPSQPALEMVGPYLESARLLGHRTAELHLRLASATEPAMAPERFTSYNQRSLYQSLRNSTSHSFRLLEAHVRDHGDAAPVEAQRVLALEDQLLRRFGGLLEGQLQGLRIRCHGDFHLGQVLFKGDDFVIIDFEGEPGRAMSERRLRRTPLRDVAGMIRSFNYAVHDVLIEQAASGLRDRGGSNLEVWGRFWTASVSASYLRGYLDLAAPAGLVPSSPEQLELLLSVCLLEKAVYEIGYELSSRPDWLRIPLRGVIELLEADL